MKGNISRQSHRPEGRYSGVFQVQGGMVTDADLGEQATIAGTRTDALGFDSVGCGVPEQDAAVTIGADGRPSLTEGTVYADGVRGRTVAADAFAGPLGYYDAQVDFPIAPPIGAEEEPKVVYADIWERCVFRLEEPLLADPGLHGAETAFRSRTMTQIKVAPAGEAEAIATGTGRFPGIGTGRLSVALNDGETIFDACDPCAEVVRADVVVANVLFRIEVLQVVGPADAPEQVVLAWSAENGSAIAPAGVDPESFERAGAVYEFFSPVTESHRGVMADSGDQRVSVFAENLADGPIDQTAPEGGDWPFVRRWDGAAELDLTAGTASRIGPGADPAFDGTVLTLTLDTFTATLDLGGAAVVAGDYWLVELRRFGTPAVRAVRETPVGIRHHYCVLFRVDGDGPAVLSDAERRRLSFPTLADLPASHVSFVDNCPKLFDGAENVQTALDNLCAIAAEDIAFDPSVCPRLYDDATDVQQALANLCRVDFGNARLLRYLHDWGVICGVTLTRSGARTGRVAIGAGSFLTRAGVIGEIDSRAVDLNDLVGTDRFHFDSLDGFANLFAEAQVCVALAVGEGGVPEVHLVAKDAALAPPDPTFISRFQSCMQERPPFVVDVDLTNRPALSRGAIEKVYLGAAKSRIAAAQRLNGEEFEEARAYNDDLVERYRAHVNDAEEVQRFDQRLAFVNAQHPLDDVQGQALEVRRLQREAARYKLVQDSNLERLQECLCRALLPACPNLGEAPHLVPIGCIEGTVQNGRIIVERVCVFECRKQALSWRMVQYYIAEFRDQFAGLIAAACCPPEEPDQPPRRDFPLVGELPFEASALPTYYGDQIARSFDILRGRTSASDYTLKPEITNLGAGPARDFLAGNGVEVAETIELTDSDAVARIRGRAVGIQAGELVFDDGRLRPGDRVALLVQDGVAVDYVKVESGPGKLIFDRPAAPGGDTAAGPDVGAVPDAGALRAELDQLRGDVAVTRGELTAAREELTATTEAMRAAEAQRTALTQSIQTATADLTAMEQRRATLVSNIASADSDLRALQTARAELALAVAASDRQLDVLQAERQQVTSGIAGVQEQLTLLRQEQEALLEAGRAERELLVLSGRRLTDEAVTLNEAAIAELNRRGAGTVGGLAATDEVALGEIAERTNTPLNELTTARAGARRRLRIEE